MEPTTTALFLLPSQKGKGHLFGMCKANSISISWLHIQVMGDSYEKKDR